MRLIITRHGETEENKKKIVQGQTVPGMLSPEGIKQAKKLAMRLKKEKIDAIYSSDLARAADTAKEIAHHHPLVPLFFVKELRERNAGEWEGKQHAAVIWDRPRPEHYITHALTKKGESLAELQERARRFLEVLIHHHKKQTILWIAHNGINSALMSVIMNQTPEDITEVPKQGNTAVTIVEIDENKNHQIILSNCDKHLL